MVQAFAKHEAEDVDMAIQEGMDALRAVLELGMEKALSGSRVAR